MVTASLSLQRRQEGAEAETSEKWRPAKLNRNGKGRRRDSCKSQHVLVRFPTGERKERRFHSTATIQSVYDYVDSLGCLEVEDYSLVSNFPRVTYGRDKQSLSLKEAGLHPQASLFVELN
ncbi:hypothetical protein GOBAR_AA28813 [Gossypium barbadense]|uniref:UBX domain-containing protein n=1 Tax=Gossypium barbadense TaxID=3634 RepID=A0A2P5WLB9_GOSBA|nr:hypothetical protein GOBAR_AA28813 [Gossypium barbadense]